MSVLPRQARKVVDAVVPLRVLTNKRFEISQPDVVGNTLSGSIQIVISTDVKQTSIKCSANETDTDPEELAMGLVWVFLSDSLNIYFVIKFTFEGTISKKQLLY